MLRRTRIAFLGLTCLLPPLPARTQPAPVRLHLVAYGAALPLLDADASLTDTAHAYRLALSMHTVGLVGLFVGGHTQAIAQGIWRGDGGAQPASYAVDGRWDGRTVLTRIAYAGDRPDVQALLPDLSRVREAVPASLTADTMDSLSAIAELVHRANTTGRCEGSARIFDGRRLSVVTVRTSGPQILARTPRSSFAGPALRCDFDGRLLAGFRFDDNRARAAQPKHGVAWLARLWPGGPLLPVRLQFETPFLGETTMYLR